MSCHSKAKLVMILQMVILVTLSFALNEYYTSALNAYVSGNYGQALEWFEKAVQMEPSLESYDSLLKLKMGICAFAIGDLQKSKAYLEQYEKTNPIAAKILALIREGGQPTEEWMVWIRSRIPQTTANVPSAETPQKKGASLLLILGVFVVSFSATFVLLYLLRRHPKKKVEVAKPEQSPAQQTDLEAKVESSISEVEQLVQQIAGSSAPSDTQSEEQFKEIEAQLDSIVQQILSQEKPKEEKEQPLLSSQEDPFEILKKLEEKTTYDDEDAKVLSDLMNKIINTQGKSQDETER
ncbi:MAG: tetratricopeptide repeat protein [Pseudothermotoga sp.]